MSSSCSCDPSREFSTADQSRRDLRSRPRELFVTTTRKRSIHIPVTPDVGLASLDASRRVYDVLTAYIQGALQNLWRPASAGPQVRLKADATFDCATRS